MITRALRWKRPRRTALLVIGVLAAASFSAAVFAAFLGDSGTVDVQPPSGDKTTSVVDATTNGGAFISYFGDSDTTFGSSGTGTFTPFVRLQGSPTEQGYNTNGAVQFETKTGTWTHAIKVSEIPQRPCPQLAPTLTCFELFVDINEANNDKLIALNKVEVWFTDNANLTGYPFTPSATTTQQYSFNGSILINDVNQGSGRGDLRYDIPINKVGSEITLPPNCNYGNPLCNTYFVLYSQWGTGGPAPAARWDSEGGFEEWKVRIYPTPPDVSVVKTPNDGQVNAGDNAVFTIVVTNNGPIAANNVVLTDTLPNGGLNWTVGGADAAACNSPVAGGGLLTCNFGTIPFPGSRTITLTSPTDASDCGAKPNTANVTATDDAVASNNSDSGQITINCAAIMILKQSTKTGNPLVGNGTDPTPANTADNATFAVDGPDADTIADFSVTDNSASDGDSTYGEVCVAGLAPGTYTISETQAPLGYGSGNPAFDSTASAVTGTNCGANQPALADRAVFRNPPLGEITAGYHDLGSGETSATAITCAPSGGSNLSAQPEASDDDIPNNGGGSYNQDSTFNVTAPGTYVCTIVVDP